MEWDAEYIGNSFIHKQDFRGKGHRVGSARGWDLKEFIAWDGEGITFGDLPLQVGEGMEWDGDRVRKRRPATPQNYVLLANSKGQELINKDGCATVDCFEMLLNVKQTWPQSIFVGFSFNYDVNQILKDVSEVKLRMLHKDERIWWRGYFIQWRPGRTFYLKDPMTKRSMKLYDCFGFFQKSFLQTCIDYLGHDDPNLQTIEEGKESRDIFEWEELDSHIRPYCQTELFMLVRIMNKLREEFHELDIVPGEWHGPGAIARKVFQKHSIPIDHDIPEEIQDASQFAYAGGRFEQFYMGRHPNTVWEYDIHSAYPAAAIHLPNISAGSWEFVERFEPGSFGVWDINYRADDRFTFSPLNRDRPQPLFCRSETGNISYPTEVQGWYWTPEAELVPDFVQGGYVFRPDTDDRPFAFIEELYEQRRLHKQQGNPVERSEKLALNSIYGKLAQTIGAIEGPPRWHQLEYAGYITSYTRAKIYQAIALAPDDIIASETDAVFSKVPLDLPLTTNLGDWEETIFEEITYIQSGFYYAVKDGNVVARCRGMDRDRRNGNQPVGLPYDKVVHHLERFTGQPNRPPKSLFCEQTRFIGLGYGLMTAAVWRSWDKTDKRIRLAHTDFTSKRIHLIDACPKCFSWINMAEEAHPLLWGGYSGPSYARRIPWRDLGGKQAPISEEERLEMSTTELDFTNLVDRWQ